MFKFKKNQVYLLNCCGNPKGTTIKIDSVGDSQVYYTYLESGLEGSASIDGVWMQSAEYVGLFPLDGPIDFYICWATDGCKPITRKYYCLDRAKEAAKYLVDKKGCKEVHIMKRELTAVIPSRVTFK